MTTSSGLKWLPQKSAVAEIFLTSYVHRSNSSWQLVDTISNSIAIVIAIAIAVAWTDATSVVAVANSVAIVVASKVVPVAAAVVVISVAVTVARAFFNDNCLFATVPFTLLRYGIW